jgi:hypothetical protein
VSAYVDVSIDKVWGDAWAIYKLLFRRSVATAVVVYAFVEGGHPLSDAIDQRWASILFGIVSFILTLAGPELVQGALVAIVRDVHEGRVPQSIPALVRSAWTHVLSLVWASLVYAVGVTVGLLLLIVPGLRAASRWCLMAPLIMLEGQPAGPARERSRELVEPHTWPVLGVVTATLVSTTIISGGVATYVWLGHVPSLWGWLLRVGALSITAPLYAHVLTVIYYRITDPEHPVIHPDVRTWRSVWQGARAE